MASVSVLYSLDIPENLWFSGISGGYKVGTLARNGLKSLQTWVCIEDWNVNTVGDDSWIFFVFGYKITLRYPNIPPFA